MMRSISLLICGLLFLTSCKEKAEHRSITVSEKRELTLHDKIFAGNIKGNPPLDWRRIPGTQFRIVNYVAGPEESVEIFVGQTQGAILENANRWVKQFKQNPLPSLSSFENFKVLGTTSFLVEAEGTYGSGMGQAAKADYALVGVIRPTSSGVITLKMVGPKNAVTEIREAFINYCKNLEIRTPQYFENEEEKS